MQPTRLRVGTFLFHFAKGAKTKAVNTGKKATHTSKITIQSVGRYGKVSPDELFIYKKKSTSDVRAIAENTGFNEHRIQRAKDYVFFKEHVLKDGSKGYFDPDYPMSLAQKRLESGKHLPSDIDLLHHEIFESRFEGIFKTDYKTAHAATVKSGRPWEIPEIDRE